jgi:hypothetical protein
VDRLSGEHFATSTGQESASRPRASPGGQIRAQPADATKAFVYERAQLPSHGISRHVPE